MKGKNNYNEILKVASGLISKKGYKAASLKEMTDIVGIHKSTFFHYFKSKEALLLTILDVAVKEPLENLKRIVSNEDLAAFEKLRCAISDHLIFGVKYFDSVNIYHNELRHLSDKRRKVYIKARKEYSHCFEQIIQEIRNKSDHFKSLDSKIVSFGILGMCNWFWQWYRKEGPWSIEEIANIFYEMIVPNTNPEW